MLRVAERKFSDLFLEVFFRADQKKRGGRTTRLQGVMCTFWIKTVLIHHHHIVVRDRPRAMRVSSLRNEKSHSVLRQARGP